MTGAGLNLELCRNRMILPKGARDEKGRTSVLNDDGMVA